MRICYVDESGHCGIKFDRHQPVEVLCGVITDISKLFKTQNEHGRIIDFLADNGVKVEEIKAAELYRGRREWHNINSKNRDAIYKALLAWSKHRVCKFVVCPIDSKAMFEQVKNGCDIAKKFQYPWEAGAFNITLAVQRENRSMKNNKGRTIIVFDEQKNHDDRFLKLFEEDLSYTDGYTCYKSRPRAKSPPRFDQIVDIPHFSKSHLTVLIQLADVAAYIVNRYICMTSYDMPEEYDGETSKFANWYKMIGKNTIDHTSIDPPGKDSLCEFYRKVRPPSWTAKSMKQ